MRAQERQAPAWHRLRWSVISLNALAPFWSNTLVPCLTSPPLSPALIACALSPRSATRLPTIVFTFISLPLLHPFEVPVFYAPPLPS